METASVMYRYREHVENVLDLAIPAHVKQEWAELQTRRHFLGRAGKVLGWAAARLSLLGNRAMRGDDYPASGAQGGDSLTFPNFAPKAKRAIYLFMSGGRFAG